MLRIEVHEIVQAIMKLTFVKSSLKSTVNEVFPAQSYKCFANGEV